MNTENSNNEEADVMNLPYREYLRQVPEGRETKAQKTRGEPSIPSYEECIRPDGERI